MRALSVRGIAYGLVFGGSKTVLQGTVSHIRRSADVAGVYRAAGAGPAVGGAVCAIMLTNQGAVRQLSAGSRG